MRWYIEKHPKAGPSEIGFIDLRRAIAVASSKIPVAADSESSGPNMETILRESGVCSFSENWRRHGIVKLLLDKIIYPKLDENDYLTTEHWSKRTKKPGNWYILNEY